MTTLRVVYDTAADTDVCAMPIGYGQMCDLPGDHDGGCTWPDQIDAAIRRHPAGNRLTTRCRCGHGPSTHTGGYGQCWQAPCICPAYRDKEVEQ